MIHGSQSQRPFIIGQTDLVWHKEKVPEKWFSGLTSEGWVGVTWQELCGDRKHGMYGESIENGGKCNKKMRVER